MLFSRLIILVGQCVQITGTHACACSFNVTIGAVEMNLYHASLA